MISFCPKDSSASPAAAAGEPPTALKLWVGLAAASPAASAAASTGAVPVGPLLTRLAVVRGCSDASWLSHTPGRFVALLENGTACQLFDGKFIYQKGGVLSLQWPLAHTHLGGDCHHLGRAPASQREEGF